MKVEIDVPEYRRETGLVTKWDADFEIDVRADHDEVVIRANPDGLRSLARHLLVLAQDGVPAGHHLHFDDGDSLEDGSTPLILERA